MPSSEIHSSSVTYCRPAAPAVEVRDQRDRVAEHAQRGGHHQPAARPAPAGTRPTSPAASGRKSDDRQVDRHDRLDHDQEVEDQPADARRAAAARRRAARRSGSSARTRCPRAPGRRCRPRSRPARSALSTTVRPKRPAARHGAHDHARRTARRSTTCSSRNRCTPGKRSRDAQPQLRVAHEVVEGERDAGDGRAGRRTPRPAHSAPSVGWSCAQRESSKVGSRKCSSVSVTPGTPQDAGDEREQRQRAPSPTFIGHSRSAMWCSEPGKPTSVSSSSPVAGLAWSPWARCPCSSSFASGHRRPEEHAEDHPERVEGGEQRREVADHAEHHVASRRGGA